MKKKADLLEENMIFVGTIYDSFEALEETLGKLKLERPLFLTYLAKMSFAEEVFKRADDAPQCRFIPKKSTFSSKGERLYN
jgi:hypothetical protein